MHPITFRTQITLNAMTVLVVVLIVLTTNTFASPSSITLGQTATTTTISYQGRLTNANGAALSATLPMTFKLYAAPSGGTALWTEGRSGANAVPVTNGLFNVLLGSITPVPISLLNRNLWLGITVNTDAEMTPREKLGTVPYAVRAGQAQTVPNGSIGTSQLASRAATDAWYISPTSAVTIPGNTDWTDIGDTAITFVQSSSAKTSFTYSINVQPNGPSETSWVATRLVVDGIPYRSSGSHFQPLSTGPWGDVNSNLTGSVLLDVGPGQHTVKLQWKSDGGSVSWSSDPSWIDGFIGARSITVLALYR